MTFLLLACAGPDAAGPGDDSAVPPPDSGDTAPVDTSAPFPYGEPDTGPADSPWLVPTGWLVYLFGVVRADGSLDGYPSGDAWIPPTLSFLIPGAEWSGDIEGDPWNVCVVSLELYTAEPDLEPFAEAAGARWGWRVTDLEPLFRNEGCSLLSPSWSPGGLIPFLEGGDWAVGLGPLEEADAGFLEGAAGIEGWEDAQGKAWAGYLASSHLDPFGAHAWAWWRADAYALDEAGGRTETRLEVGDGTALVDAYVNGTPAYWVEYAK